MAASLDEAYLDITEVCRERGISGLEVSWNYCLVDFLSLSHFSVPQFSFHFYREVLFTYFN